MYKYNLTNNSIFAEKLFSYIGVGKPLNKEDERECEKIFNECERSRFKYFDKIIEICGNEDSSRARYIRAMVYSWHSTIHSKDAIKCTEYYLNNELYKDSYNEICNFDFIKCLPFTRNKMKKYFHLYSMFIMQAKNFEHDKQFLKAIEIYEDCKKYTLFIDKYDKDRSLTKTIDNCIIALEKKIEKMSAKKK